MKEEKTKARRQKRKLTGAPKARATARGGKATMCALLPESWFLRAWRRPFGSNMQFSASII